MDVEGGGRDALIHPRRVVVGRGYAHVAKRSGSSARLGDDVKRRRYRCTEPGECLHLMSLISPVDRDSPSSAAGRELS
jgi:hypothetical protein